MISRKKASDIKATIRGACTRNKHHMTPFIATSSGARAYCKRCGESANFNSISGAIWGTAHEAVCIPVEGIKVDTRR